MAANRSPQTAALMAPEGIFVVHLRSDSTADGDVRGRVEHVKSGASERFGSLADLLSFMTRHAQPETES